MKKISFLILVMTSGLVYADVRVNGYTRSDGTYVAPYTRSSPDSTRNNNYSTQGNVNPYTGQMGTQRGDYGYGGQPAGSGYSSTRIK